MNSTGIIWILRYHFNKRITYTTAALYRAFYSYGNKDVMATRYKQASVLIIIIPTTQLEHIVLVCHIVYVMHFINLFRLREIHSGKTPLGVGPVLKLKKKQT